jgi:hypothetical protein
MKKNNQILANQLPLFGESEQSIERIEKCLNNRNGRMNTCYLLIRSYPTTQCLVSHPLSM